MKGVTEGVNKREGDYNMRPDILAKQIRDMTKQTMMGKMRWNVEIHTTDADTDKVRVKEDGKEWVVDECFTSFACQYQNQDFCMITYEVIKTYEGQVRSNNMVFMPPAFQRVFDLNMLISHMVDMDQVLAANIHKLYEEIYQLHKKGDPKIIWSVKGSAQNAES